METPKFHHRKKMKYFVVAFVILRAHLRSFKKYENGFAVACVHWHISHSKNGKSLICDVILFPGKTYAPS